MLSMIEALAHSMDEKFGCPYEIHEGKVAVIVTVVGERHVEAATWLARGLAGTASHDFASSTARFDL